jgi:4-amino-4-deoxy-L-arabinose transferase-like glycosyltransferase
MLAGVFIGLGVLAKGPVILIHLGAPILLFPLWRNPEHDMSPRRFFSGVMLAFAIGLGVTAAWLGPALYSTGMDFAYNLIWQQSAGRIAGSTGNAHARPFYFYLPLIPLSLLPWLLSTDMWRLKPYKILLQVDPARKRVLSLLGAWFALVLVVFSLISGKQPHYLVPLLPVVVILFSYVMAKVPMRRIRISVAIMIALFAAGQAIAAATVFNRFDLSPTAAVIAANSEADWAFVGRYQGQFTFLARHTKPLDIIAADETRDWLRTHPGGFVVAKVGSPDALPDMVHSQRAGSGYYVVLGNAAPAQ